MVGVPDDSLFAICLRCINIEVIYFFLLRFPYGLADDVYMHHISIAVIDLSNNTSVSRIFSTFTGQFNFLAVLISSSAYRPR